MSAFWPKGLVGLLRSVAIPKYSTGMLVTRKIVACVTLWMGTVSSAKATGYHITLTRVAACIISQYSITWTTAIVSGSCGRIYYLRNPFNYRKFFFYIIQALRTIIFLKLPKRLFLTDYYLSIPRQLPGSYPAGEKICQSNERTHLTFFFDRKIRRRKNTVFMKLTLS